MNDYRLTRLDWGVGTNIESIRFTMSNGDISPKYGKKPFTASCDFDSRVTKLKSRIRDNRLIAMTFYTEHDGEFLTV